MILFIGSWSQPSTTPKISEDTFPRNTSLPNFKVPPPRPDPFANLASSMGSGLTNNWNGTPKESNVSQSSSPVTAGEDLFKSTTVKI